MRRSTAALAACLLLPLLARAHDIWVQGNAHLVRTGDAIHLDLLLGNHGNDHRDFKVAGKFSPEAVDAFTVIDPKGKRYDLKPDLTDLGYAPKEGFHTARFVPGTPGLHAVVCLSDRVVNHGKPVRSVRCAKGYFVASDSLDAVAKNLPGFDRPEGADRLELVPQASPVAPMGPGVPLKVQLRFQGKPRAGVKVSFIPRGVTLKEGTDAEYERTTDAEGRASFTPKSGNYYLIVARVATDEKGPTHEATQYTATLCVLVPEKCPCCE